MATSPRDGGGATGEGKSLGARRARLNQSKADPLPAAWTPAAGDRVWQAARHRASGDAPRSGPVQSLTSIAESRLTGARHSLRSKGERGRLRQVAVDDESLDLGRAVAFKLGWARAVRFSRAGRRSAPVVCR